MSAPSPVPSAGSSSATAMGSPAVRVSGRSRHKSQRVLQSEDTLRALARAKAKESISVESSPKPRFPAARRTSRKGKAKASDEVYCVCKTRNPGAMIECAECQDWFHFDCMELSPDEADLILEYRCPDCEAATGNKTTRKYDLDVLGSPSPPPGFPSPPKKMSKRGKKGSKAKPMQIAEDESEEAEEASSDSSDSGSEAAFSEASNTPRRLSKRRRISASTTNLIQQARKASTNTNKKRFDEDQGPLPAARQYCYDKLVAVSRKTFEIDMTEEDITAFGAQVEAAMYAACKEFVNGKPVAGAKYKGQFQRLSSAMDRGLRSSLRAALLDKSVSPAQFATFTPADLASDSQLEEIMKVQRASLQQSVKEAPVSIPVRVGRDGYEEQVVIDHQKAEEEHETDSAVGDDSVPSKAEPEPSATEADATIEQLDVSDALNHVAASQAAEAAAEASAAHVDPELPSPRKASFPVPTPLRRPNTFALTSAWGSSRSGEGQQEESNEAEYDPLRALADEASASADFGVFGAEDGDVEAEKVFDEYLLAPDVEMEVVPEVVKVSPHEAFMSKPVVWAGTLNVQEVAPVKPRIEARLLCPLSPELPNAAWEKFLPNPCIATTGRVPVQQALKFLNEIFFKPGIKLVAVAFTTAENASPEEADGFDKLVDFHIKKDRHALYLPYGPDPKRVPKDAIKEWYLIPLRPTDPVPEITELIDGCEVPEERARPMYLAIAIATRGALELAAGKLVPPPVLAPVTAPALPANIPTPAQLAALVANINPVAIASIVDQGRPAASPLPARVYSPMPPFPPTPRGLHGGASPFAPQAWTPQQRHAQSPLSHPSPQRYQPDGRPYDGNHQQQQHQRGNQRY